MTNVADLSSLYLRGMHPERAVFHFGDQAAVRRYKELVPKVHTLRLLVDGLATAFGKASELPPNLKVDPNEVSESLVIRRRLEGSFVARLYRGEFIALGFEVPREPSNEP